MLHCAICDGLLTFIGQLGSMMHFRCRDCGAQYSYNEQEVE